MTREEVLASHLSEYVNRLNDGNAPCVDEFCARFASDIGHELRPLLWTALYARQFAISVLDAIHGELRRGTWCGTGDREARWPIFARAFAGER